MKTLLSAAVLAAMAGVASADVTREDAPQFAGYVNVDFATGETTYSDHAFTTRAVTSYTNTASMPNAAFSSTDFNSVWGDEVHGVASGLVTAQQYTVYNSGSSLTALLTCTVQLLYYKLSDSSLIGGFNGNINFGPSGLAKGFYSVVTFSGLDGLGINLPTADLLVTQKMTAHSGSTRAGFASLDPVTIGTSPAYFYANSSTVGPAGYYNLSGGINANPGYQIDVPAPSALALMGLGGLVAGRRRR